jgi:hypothetical protein
MRLFLSHRAKKPVGKKIADTEGVSFFRFQNCVADGFAGLSRRSVQDHQGQIRGQHDCRHTCNSEQ